MLSMLLKISNRPWHKERLLAFLKIFDIIILPIDTLVTLLAQ